MIRILEKFHQLILFFWALRTFNTFYFTFNFERNLILLFTKRIISLLAKTIFISRRPEVFLGEGVLKICSKFTGEHLLYIFRAPFTKNTTEWLLLNICNNALMTNSKVYVITNNVTSQSITQSMKHIFSRSASTKVTVFNQKLQAMISFHIYNFIIHYTIKAYYKI